jgi:hypothetical protein
LKAAAFNGCSITLFVIDVDVDEGRLRRGDGDGEMCECECNKKARQGEFLEGSEGA